MFPFDTSPFYSAPASYFVVECGAHINLAVQPAGSLQQATKVAQARRCTSISAENVHRAIGKAPEGVCIG